MANRVLMGKGTTARGGTDKYGLWISKPGQNVLTCTDDQLILNTDIGTTDSIAALFQTSISSYASTEGHEQIKFLSPYALFTRPILGQNLFSLTKLYFL